jgi:cytochrome c5
LNEKDDTMASRKFMITTALLSVVGLASSGQTAGLGGDPGSPNGIEPETKVAMMGYGMMGHGMMHHAMMGHGDRMDMRDETMSGRFPPGLPADMLPTPDSPGAQLLVRYCTQCHNLPSPALHAPEEWPAVAARMFKRMRRIAAHSGMMWGGGSHGGMGIRTPMPGERKILVAYLQRQAITPADQDASGPSDAPGPTLFRQVCSGCHHPPDPQSHTAAEWPGVVERMQHHAESMAKPEITDNERDEIVLFLKERARG